MYRTRWLGLASIIRSREMLPRLWPHSPSISCSRGHPNPSSCLVHGSSCLRVSRPRALRYIVSTLGYAGNRVPWWFRPSSPIFFRRFMTRIDALCDTWQRLPECEPVPKKSVTICSAKKSGLKWWIWIRVRVPYATSAYPYPPLRSLSFSEARALDSWALPLCL